MIRSFLLSISLMLALPANASTGFHIGNGATKHLPSVYGISTGWYYEIKAAMTANPRGLRKTAETFGAPVTPLTWTSSYGSVTQTMHGLEFPMSGMNERGLIIQATVLKGQVPMKVPAGGAGLFGPQWIQYQLDTAATVADVLKSSMNPDAPILPQGNFNIQFQICDLKDCAVLAFYEQKAVAQGSMGRVETDFERREIRADASNVWLVSAIANNTYAESLAAYRACRAFPCVTPDDSLNRFIKAAEMVRHFTTVAPMPLSSLLTDVLAQLKAVDQGVPMTTWNEAYAFAPAVRARAAMVLAFKAPTRPDGDVQWIDFSSQSFDCREPAKLWWLRMDQGGGDRTATAVLHTRADQETLARQHPTTMPAAQMAFIIDYPAAKTKCLSRKEMQ